MMQIDQVRLEDGDVAVSILNFGAITHGWWVPCGGTSVPVVLGYDDPRTYLQESAYLGAIVGRIANRTAGGKLLLGHEAFQLSQNEGITHLHGGFDGLHRRFWAMERDTAARQVQLSYTSRDGEEGYPGTAEITITIALQGSTLTYDMQAYVDRPTPINLAQHNYYNLLGQGAIWNHTLTCAADRMTPVDDAGITTGALESVVGTPLDFRSGATFQANDPNHMGADTNLVLPDDHDPQSLSAVVHAPNGLRLRMWSDQPGMQLYTGAGLSGRAGAHAQQEIAPFAGFCLEPQGFPDAVNTPNFPSIIVTPDAPYRQKLSVEIKQASP
ncbi:MAG: aldose epimerase family protein [Devosiaceae bacterium]